jgi:hypothetical protein
VRRAAAGQAGHRLAERPEGTVTPLPRGEARCSRQPLLDSGSQAEVSFVREGIHESEAVLVQYRAAIRAHAQLREPGQISRECLGPSPSLSGSHDLSGQTERQRLLRRH